MKGISTSKTAAQRKPLSRRVSLRHFQSIAKCTSLLVIILILTAVCPAQRDPRASQLKIVQLSPPTPTGPFSLEQALAKNRTVRRFTTQPLNLNQIGQIAWAAKSLTPPQSASQDEPPDQPPYPMNLYFATADGLFAYHPNEHSLEQLFDRDVRDRLAAAARHEPVAQAPCYIVIAGSAKKLAAKYGSRAGRCLLLEAGHIAQNIRLQAVALQLGSLPVWPFDMTQVRKICKLSMQLEPLYIICVGYPEQPNIPQTNQPETETQAMHEPKTQKAVLIIPSQKFRDEELLETKRLLDQAGVQTIIASTKTGVIKGMLRAKVEADILVNDIVVDDYDAVIFIGGSGAKEYFDSSVALNIARQAARKQRILAAICIAPTVLANAGLLDGVKATAFSTEKYRLKRSGAQYTGAELERDGLIITANGPKAAARFGKAIVNALEEQNKSPSPQNKAPSNKTNRPAAK
jgi:protease I